MESLRNASLAGAENYHSRSSKNAAFDVSTKVKSLIDTTPILSKPVASKLAGKITDKVNQTIAASIWGKIKTQQDMDVDGMIKYCKIQKHDKLFGNLVLIASHE